MKLDDKIKKRIDDFFDNISAEELYSLSVNKYGFPEISSLDNISKYFTVKEFFIKNNKCNDFLSIFSNIETMIEKQSYEKDLDSSTPASEYSKENTFSVDDSCNALAA